MFFFSLAFCFCNLLISPDGGDVPLKWGSGHIAFGSQIMGGVGRGVTQNLFTWNSPSYKGPGTCTMKTCHRCFLGVLTSWLSVSGGGGVTLLDSGHAGVLFPLCPATKCLPGGFQGLLPEPPASQYPLKGLLEVPRATPQ